ncbi:MAG: hypothetical protein RLY87_1001 [Chloroflexota bacterium]|jgi:3D-(3,5/4)-trihydroxycyclohexane-1,2-dione acylhydrolase (decyclizing)
MSTTRLTVAQAVVTFLTQQSVERDGIEQKFFAGCFGIFGHGNVSGMGQALQQIPALRYYQARNEQAMVHAATAYAKTANRLQTLACTTSIGPGATNMVTGAATATINRLPVLLLPGDIFARRNVDPVLQQLEWAHSRDVSANDCFKPVSKYWDRINRPDQLSSALFEAMRVLTSPSDTGAVTLALPQDVQTEAFDFPTALFRPRTWHIPRQRPDIAALQRAVARIKAAKRPLIIAGGGVIYSDATAALTAFVDATGIPIGETMAGKGALPYHHPLNLGAIGVTGTFAANQIARDADLIIGIGTRYSDFTTSSKTAFAHPDVHFININVCELDAVKHAATSIVGDARACLEELLVAVQGYSVDAAYRATAQRLSAAWDQEVQRIYDIRLNPLPSQGELIGAVNELSDPGAIMVCAAGSLPGDLHKLWRARHPKNYHLEYGNSCMGYEVAGGLGIKMAAPDREVYVMVGDGSWLMMSSEIVTAIQEDRKLIVILMDNDGYKSIGGLSRSLGQSGFGTRYAYSQDNRVTSDADGNDVVRIPIDLAQNARSLGATVIECTDYDAFVAGIAQARRNPTTTVVYVRNDRYHGVPGYDSWWDVPPAEVSTNPEVQAKRTEWAANRTRERDYLG